MGTSLFSARHSITSVNTAESFASYGVCIYSAVVLRGCRLYYNVVRAQCMQASLVVLSWRV